MGNQFPEVDHGNNFCQDHSRHMAQPIQLRKSGLFVFKICLTI